MKDIELIEDLINRAASVTYDNKGEFDALKKRTAMIVRRVFGDQSHYLKELTDIKYTPIMIIGGVQNDWRSPFERGIKEFRNVLQVMLDDRKLSASLNAETEPSVPKNPAQQDFINPERIKDLEQLAHPDFDFRKLISYCRELNDNYARSNFLSVTMLGRSIINHIPPVFGMTTFNEVASNYGKTSFKKSMMHLNASMKNIADSYLHDPIRKKESLPNGTQVNFSQDMDVLLAEVIRKAQEG